MTATDLAALFVQSAAIVAVGLLASRVAWRAGPDAQSIILRTTLVALLAVPLATWLLSAAGVDGLRSRANEASVATPPTPIAMASVEPPRALESSAPQRADAAAVMPPAMMAATPRAATPKAIARSRFTANDAPRAAVIVWSAVATALLARTVAAMLWIASIRRRARPADDASLARCRRVAREFGIAAPPLLVTPRVGGPCLVGIRSPAILLPSDDADRDVIVHELAHLRRHDCAWLLAARIACAIFWFQPLAWLLARSIERVADDACDDAVATGATDGERAAYAARLVDLAERRRERWPAAAGAAGVVTFRSNVARRVVRVLDAARPMPARVGPLLLMIIVTLGAAGTVAAALLGLDPATSQPTNHTTADPADTNSADTNPADTIRVRGRVLDPDGKPAAGATVTVAAPKHWDRPLERAIVARATADADGRFEIAFTKSSVSPFSVGGGQPGGERWKTTKVVASAAGSGVAFTSWDDRDAAGDVTLRLARDDVPIRGRIVDAQGAPLAGVRIAVDLLALRDHAELEKAYAADAKAAAARLMLDVPLAAAGQDEPIVTDADGRFRIDGLGAGRRAFLQLASPGVGYARVEAATIEREPKLLVIPQPAGFDSEYQTYGATFEHKAWPAQSVSGVIRDAATGEPTPGVRVESLSFPRSPSFGLDPRGMIRSVTDAEGRYRLEGFPSGDGNRIIVVPAEDQPYFMREAELPAGQDATIDVALHRGVFVTGKVTDKATGRPLPARMIYTTYGDNPFVQDLPPFRRTRGSNVLDGYQSRYETRADGSYRLVAAPGKAIIGVWCFLEGYRKGVGFDAIPVFAEEDFVFRLFQQAPFPSGTNVVREIDVPAGAGEVTCDLQVDPGASVRVSVLDPDGKPAARELRVRGQDAENYGGPYLKPVAGPSFDARGFAPDEARTIFVIDDERSVGAAEHANADTGEIELRLRPLAEVSGRLLDTAGKPLANLELDVSEAIAGGRTARFVKTDDDGRFTIRVPAGVTYRASVWSGAYVGATVADDLDLEPGPNAELGDIKIAPYLTD